MDELEMLKSKCEELKCAHERLRSQLNDKDEELCNVKSFVKEQEQVIARLSGMVSAYEFALECIGKR